MPVELIRNKEIPLQDRVSPIIDEVLEACVLQINHGQKTPQPYDSFGVCSLNQVDAWADFGMSFVVAATIARKEIPDSQAKIVLAKALQNNAGYLKNQPMYSTMKEKLDPKIEGMKAAAFRLRFL